MDGRTPAKFYQDMFRELVHPSRRVKREESWLREELGKLDEDESGDRTSRYILAAGLLAYGNLEMAEVILDNVSVGARGKAAFFGSNAIRALLPIPEELGGEAGWYNHVKVEEVRQWLHRHRDDLQWDERAGRHVLVGQ
jgi:hypothetical protein